MLDGKIFAQMQRLGRALMLPIAVLPVAGLLLRFGQPDVFNIAVIAQAGSTLFENLPMLFAIGVAVGFAKDNNGAAALAGASGYLIEIAVMKSVNPDLNMGVLAGIVAGLTAGTLYNRFKDIKLPEYLAFFGGKRFVPIVTSMVCLILGVIFSYAWAPVQAGINEAGHWMTTAGALGAFLFGVMNRLLLVAGLQHIIDSLAWFVFGTYTPPGGTVVTGDLHRFFAGDKTAGTFMTGFFPVLMFGLPAACLAMYHEAAKDQRALVGGALLSMALTTFLTGITEPVEFTFMFLAPVLYVIHALLTGLSLAVCQALGIHLGFTFSAGLIDYVLSYGLSTRGWLALPIGTVYALIYYGMFRFFIRRFDLATPGRRTIVSAVEEQDLAAAVGPNVVADVVAKPATVTRAELYVDALGGAENLTLVDACTTRLRLTVVDSTRISEDRLKKIGVKGVLKRGASNVQVVIGPEADIVSGEIRAFISDMGMVALLKTVWVTGFSERFR